jgi:hypothetical protein
MKGRYEIKDSQQTPGPGAYASNNQNKGPSITMALRGKSTIFASSTNPLWLKELPRVATA